MKRLGLLLLLGILKMRLVEESTNEGARGRKGGSTAFCQHLCPQAASAEEELLSGVDVLLEVFPTCSMEQAQWVLAKARGDLEEAVQMLVEGKEEPPAWDGPNQVSSAIPSPTHVAPATFLLSVKPPPLAYHHMLLLLVT